MPTSLGFDSARGAEGFHRLKPLDLVQELVGQLRGRILSGQFGDSGELPTESQLSESFGVSRTVAREAMRTLRTQGLVEVSRGRRPRVKPADSQVALESLQALLTRSATSLHQLGEIRRPLEVEIAGLAAVRATEPEIAALQEAVDAQSASRTVKKQVEFDCRFHELLAAATRNSLFPLLLSTIAPLLNEARRTTISRVGITGAIEGHIAILKAIRARHPDEARKAMQTHLLMAEADLKNEEG